MLINLKKVLLKTLLVIYPNNKKKMGIFNEQSFDHPFAKGIQGAPGVGFKLTSSGDFDISGKKLTNIGTPTANSDAATKKYVDDNSSRSSKTSTLTVDSNIDMKDRFRIVNLKHPSDADEPATKQYADSMFLDRNGDRGMIANLVMNNHKIVQLGAPSSNTDAATKKYVDDSVVKPRNISMGNQFRITNLKTPVDPHEPPTKSYVDNTFLERDGSYPMTGNLNMGSHKITALRTPTASLDAATKKYVDDNISNSSPDLSDYLEKDGTVTMTGSLKMGNNKIVGLATPTSNTDAATKKYVDDKPNGVGDFKKDGTVAMTGNLNMGTNRIVSLADPINSSDSTNMSWVKNQIQHFNVLSSPVFTVEPAPAYSTIYLQYQNNRFVFTTSRPGQPLISWRPASGTYINKIVFNFNRSINVKKISFVARDSRISNIDFWISGTHTGLFTLNIHRTWNYEMSGVFMYYISDANSNHPPITANIYTGKPSATTKDFSKITFNSPTVFTSTVTATTPTTSTQVATKDYVDRSVAGPAHYKNVFDYIMESAAQWTDEITTRTSFVIKKIGDLSPNSGNFHTYNHRAVFLGLKKYSAGYKFKFGLNFFRLPASDYTICLELLNLDYRLWHKTQINVDHQSSSGLTFHSESVKKLTHTYYYPTNNLNYMYYHRVIVSFTKNSSGRSFFHVTVNIPEVNGDMISYPSEFTKFYVIVYGINGAVGNIDPDRSYDYHTAFDIQPSQVVYNVGIDMNNKAITNLYPDQNTNSAATFGAVSELRNLIPNYFYQNLFEEIWDFKMGDKYVLSPSSSGINFNKLKSLKETSEITFNTAKSIDNLVRYGLDMGNNTLNIPIPDNYTNLNLFIIFKFWDNNSFQIIRHDTQANSRLADVAYDKNTKRLIVKSGRQTSTNSFPNGFSGKKIILWFKQTSNTALYIYISNSNYLRAIGFGTITPRKQKITFYSGGSYIYKVMFTSNMSINNTNILIQEYLTDIN